jgi:hypothetical protein
MEVNFAFPDCRQKLEVDTEFCSDTGIADFISQCELPGVVFYTKLT